VEVALTVKQANLTSDQLKLLRRIIEEDLK